jgi:hypothetical protein
MYAIIDCDSGDSGLRSAADPDPVKVSFVGCESGADSLYARGSDVSDNDIEVD